MRIFFLAFLVYSTELLANDSIVSIDNAGFQLLATDLIQMESEELELSETLVKVKYQFRNLSKQDLTFRVGFPFPPIEKIIGSDTCCFKGDTNPMSFHGTSEGRPIKFEIIKHESQTNYSYTYHWNQVFPGGKSIQITHEYRPNVGGMPFNPFQDLERTPTESIDNVYKTFLNHEDPSVTNMIADYCIELNTFKAIRNSKDMLFTSYLTYILTTGNNWHGPIKRFKLTVKKSKPEQIVSFCGDEVRKIDALTFEMVKENFVPKRELEIAWFGSAKYY